ncbi:MAG TPA: hypothetical protein VIR33_03470, partial [Thermopolyspora sp.]
GERLERSDRIELTIVESGARRDLGQSDAAVVTLQRLPELRDPQRHPWSARLAFAYADALADAGHEAAATDWFSRAMEFDEDGETDAAERYAELTGTAIEDVEEAFDEPEGASERDPESATEAESAAESVADADSEARAGEEGTAEEAIAEAETDDEISDAEDGEGVSQAQATGAATDPAEPAAAEPAETGERKVSQDESVQREESESEADQRAESEPGAEGTDDAQGSSGPAVARPEIGVGPAFIEPDFGTAVSDGGDSMKEKISGLE